MHVRIAPADGNEMILKNKHQVATEADYEAWMANDSPEKRVESILGDLSEEILWAGWAMGLESQAWQWVTEGLSEEDMLNPREQISHASCLAMIAELKRLTFDAGWWPYYPDWPVGYKVPLAEWEQFYESKTKEWRERFSK